MFIFSHENDDLGHYTSRDYYCTLPIFSQVCVCPQGGCAWQGACVAGGIYGWGMHGRGPAWWGGCVAGVMHDRGCAWWGACVARGHVKGACIAGGVHGGEGACVADTTRYGQ